MRLNRPARLEMRLERWIDVCQLGNLPPDLPQRGYRGAVLLVQRAVRLRAQRDQPFGMRQPRS